LAKNSKEAHDRAEAQFHTTLKATRERKKAPVQYEVESQAIREKTARLRTLRLAKEAADGKTVANSEPVTKKGKPSP
jgi:hypothetical protein